MMQPRIHRSFGLLEQSIMGSDLQTLAQSTVPRPVCPSLGRVLDGSKVLSGDRQTIPGVPSEKERFSHFHRGEINPVMCFCFRKVFSNPSNINTFGKGHIGE